MTGRCAERHTVLRTVQFFAPCEDFFEEVGSTEI